ncbi:hypothetical protein B0O99DRAFT_683820 [Bisporella sp. PMI_857]|nr:hypothetical protein B0O99DRAFT_683820 [Bisporella sp. PMI_857]
MSAAATVSTKGILAGTDATAEGAINDASELGSGSLPAETVIAEWRQGTAEAQIEASNGYHDTEDLYDTNTYAGLVNSIRKTVEKVTLDTDVNITAIISSWIELNNQFILCTALPLCVLVRPTHDYNLSFFGIFDGLVPVFPVQIRKQIRGIPSLSFYRNQIPLTLGFAFTDYKSQGSTFASLILDLLFGKQPGVDQHGKWTSINVQLGRVKSLSGVWLRGLITLNDISFALHPGLRVELEVLTAEAQTV